MRYSMPATVGLNLLSALYKMRSLSHLVDEADALGPLRTCADRQQPRTQVAPGRRAWLRAWSPCAKGGLLLLTPCRLPHRLVLGTLAFSACNLLMAAEAWYLERAAGPAGGSTASGDSTDDASPSKGGAGSAGGALPCVQTPVLRSTLAKHFCYLLLLLTAHGTTSRLVYSVAKVVVLGCLFANYNQGLLTDATAAAADGVGSPLIRSPSCQYLMATLHIPAPAKRAHAQRIAGSDGWMGMALVWLVGIATLGQGCHKGSRRAAAPATTVATSLLRRAGAEPKHAVRAPLAFGQGIGLHQRVGAVSSEGSGGASNVAAAAVAGLQDRREL